MFPINRRPYFSPPPPRPYFLKAKWLAHRHTGVLDNRLVRRHTVVQVYSGIYLERRYAVPAAGTRSLIS